MRLKGVDDETHVRHSGPGRHIGQVGNPQLIRPIGHELAVDQVRMPLGCRIGASGTDPTSPPHSFDAQLAHQSGDLVPADGMAGTPCGFPQLVRPI